MFGRTSALDAGDAAAFELLAVEPAEADDGPGKLSNTSAITATPSVPSINLRLVGIPIMPEGAIRLRQLQAETAGFAETAPLIPRQPAQSTEPARKTEPHRSPNAAR